MIKVTYLVLLIFLTAASSAFAQNNRRTIFQTRLEPLIEKEVREKKLVGFAVGIVKNGKVIYAKGFGTAKLGDNKLITPQSLFHTASLTKPFVATAIMQLVERGKIDLDAPVIKYVPYFRLKDNRYTTITIRQMLSHTSGMPDVKGNEDYNWDKPEYDAGALERYVRSLNNLSLIAAPGEKVEYSNIAYEVLGDVIAKASEMSFEDYVQKNILKPLGMKRSTLLVRQTDANLLVSPHIRDKATGKTEVSKIFPYNRAHAPSSTLYSNIEDMNRWAMANLNRGELNGRRILKASSYDLLWKPVADVGEIPTFPSGMKVGLSWFIWNYNGHRMIEHRGGDVGFRSYIELAPDDSFSIVILSNDAGANSSILDIVKAATDLILEDSVRNKKAAVKNNGGV
ncbi:MAG: serine hydrolase domain-containing protein [Pyrinomonadaceae bacterium]